jgi:hypothetical protein
MATRPATTSLGQWSGFVVVLGVVAVVGFLVGSWIGDQSLGSVPPAGPAPAASASAPAASASNAPGSGAPSAGASAATSSDPGVPNAVVTIKGSGNDTTEPFDVDPGWQIQWRADAGSFALTVSGTIDLGTIVDESGPAVGVTSIGAGGTYRIDVTAEGAWSVTIVQGGG